MKWDLSGLVQRKGDKMEWDGMVIYIVVLFSAWLSSFWFLVWGWVWFGLSGAGGMERIRTGCVYCAGLDFKWLKG
jgi:hypothetical protein